MAEDEKTHGTDESLDMLPDSTRAALFARYSRTAKPLKRVFLDEFDRANAANRETNTHAQWLNSLFFPAIEIFGMVAIASVLAWARCAEPNASLT